MGDAESRGKVRFDSQFLAELDTLEIINSIDGNELELQLVELASIGGDELPSLHGGKRRYATNRPALSPEDKQANEEFIIPLVERTGAELRRHPLGVIALMEGEQPDLPPIVIMSHTDTVPNGDMFDGTTGSLAAIALFQAIADSGFRPKRSLVGAFVTGEESAEFNIALFGSRGLWHGLKDTELAMTNRCGDSIADLLGEEGTEIARRPEFGPLGDEIPAPAAVIELHVEQGSVLEEKAAGGEGYSADIGIVESIAAPARFKVLIGEEPLTPDDSEYAHASYMRLSVAGKAGHSGATPMGVDSRADGLVEMESFLQQAINEHSDMAKLLSIGNIDIDGQSINKIPGITETIIRVAGDDREKIEEATRFLEFLVDQRNDMINERHPRFDPDPVSLKKIRYPEGATFFQPQQEMLRRQIKAFGLIRVVHDAARIYAGEEVVGTVGTYDTDSQGRITLGLDLRGMTQDGRQQMMDAINRQANAIGAPLGEALPGSGEPTRSDPKLVQKAVDVMKRFETGEPRLMDSKAGHDIQNAARAGVPTVLLFCRSEAGIAHHPDAYTRPEDLQKGARSMAALVLELAAE